MTHGMRHRPWIVMCCAFVAAGCTRVTPPRANPRPDQRIQVHARIPRQFDIEVEDRVVARPTLSSVSGPMEWMRGDTVRLRVWNALDADRLPWNPPVAARATVVLDGATNVLMVDVDPEKTATLLLAIVGVAALGFALVLVTIAAGLGGS